MGHNKLDPSPLIFSVNLISHEKHLTLESKVTQEVGWQCCGKYQSIKLFQTYVKIAMCIFMVIFTTHLNFLKYTVRFFGIFTCKKQSCTFLKLFWCCKQRLYFFFVRLVLIILLMLDLTITLTQQYSMGWTISLKELDLRRNISSVNNVYLLLSVVMFFLWSHRHLCL